MRSELTTLGPLPQGAGDRWRGRGASFIFPGTIDSHLPPPVPGKTGGRPRRASASWLREFASDHFLLLSLLLLFDGLSAPVSSPLTHPGAPLQVNPPDPAPAPSPGSAQLESRKREVESVYFVSPGAPPSHHLSFLSTPPPSISPPFPPR